jgi:hypothetical protein
MGDNWNKCWIINIRIPNIPWLKMPIGAKRIAAYIPEIRGHLSLNSRPKAGLELGN